MRMAVKAVKVMKRLLRLVKVGKVWIGRMIERMSGSGALRGRREVLRRIS